MQPDQLLEVDNYINNEGVLFSEKTPGEPLIVRCEFRLYQHMLWCGEGQPRQKGNLSVAGRVWLDTEPRWALLNIGNKFSMALAEDKHLNFYITDANGTIGSVESFWKSPAQ